MSEQQQQQEAQQTREQIIARKGLVPRGTSKSAQKRQAAAELSEEEKIRQAAFDNAKLPEWKTFEEVSIPEAWRRADHSFVVCERINCIPPDFIARLSAWSLAHLGAFFKPPRIPSAEDLNRAGGININDLFIRFSIRPIRVFANAEDASAFAQECSKTLKGTITVLRFYQPNVQPPYTTAQVVHRDEDYAKFMKAFRRYDNEEKKEFEQHVVDLYKEMQTLSARSQDESKKLLLADGKNAAIPKPSNIHQTVGGDIGLVLEGEDGVKREKKRLEELEQAEDLDKDWFENALASENPDKALAEIVSTSEGFLEGFTIKAKTIQKHINLLRSKIARARSHLEASVQIEATQAPDVDAPAAVASDKIKIKRFMSSPDGTQLYVIGLDNLATLIKPEDRDKYQEDAASATATSTVTDAVNADVWYDASQPMPTRLSRTQRMAMATTADSLISDGGSEQQCFESVDDMMARLAAYNAKMREQREKEEELIRQGIDPRTVYPIPEIGEYPAAGC